MDPVNLAAIASMLGISSTYVPWIRLFAKMRIQDLFKTKDRKEAPASSPARSGKHETVGKLLDVIQACRDAGDEATAKALSELLPAVALTNSPKQDQDSNAS